jgi:hypothetical protein
LGEGKITTGKREIWECWISIILIVEVSLEGNTYQPATVPERGVIFRPGATYLYVIFQSTYPDEV